MDHPRIRSRTERAAACRYLASPIGRGTIRPRETPNGGPHYTEPNPADRRAPWPISSRALTKSSTKARTRRTPSPSSTTTPRRSSRARRWPTSCASQGRTGIRCATAGPTRSAQRRASCPGTSPTRWNRPATRSTRCSSSARSSGCSSTASTTGTSPPKARLSPTAAGTSTRSSSFSRRSRKKRASPRCGGRRVCSRTPDSCTGRAPAAMPTCSHTPGHRSPRPSKSPTNSADRATSSGAAGRATKAC